MNDVFATMGGRPGNVVWSAHDVMKRFVEHSEPLLLLRDPRCVRTLNILFRCISGPAWNAVRKEIDETAKQIINLLMTVKFTPSLIITGVGYPGLAHLNFKLNCLRLATHHGRPNTVTLLLQKWHFREKHIAPLATRLALSGHRQHVECLQRMFNHPFTMVFLDMVCVVHRCFATLKQAADVRPLHAPRLLAKQAAKLGHTDILLFIIENCPKVTLEWNGYCLFRAAAIHSHAATVRTLISLHVHDEFLFHKAVRKLVKPVIDASALPVWVALLYHPSICAMFVAHVNWLHQTVVYMMKHRRHDKEAYLAPILSTMDDLSLVSLCRLCTHAQHNILLSFIAPLQRKRVRQALVKNRRIKNRGVNDRRVKNRGVNDRRVNNRRDRKEEEVGNKNKSSITNESVQQPQALQQASRRQRSQRKRKKEGLRRLVSDAML